MPIQSHARYGSVAQALHWATALLVLIAFVYGPGGSEERVYSPARDFDRQLHETLGLCVFALVALRAAWRFFDQRPDPPQVPRWMGTAATVVQAVLYLLVFAVPSIAIAGAWLEGHPLTLLGNLVLEPRIAKSHELGSILATVHTWLGDTLLWVAGFHALAGLYHHFVLKDGVFESMFPQWLPIRRSRRR